MPEVGQWASRDPLGFGAGDSNLFAYVASDPINHFDPSGLEVFPKGVPVMNVPPSVLEATVLAAPLVAVGSAIAAIVGAGAASQALVASTGGIASSTASSLLLARQLASEAQYGQIARGIGEAMAGAMCRKPIQDLPRLLAQYGGQAKDWVKITSTTQKLWNGVSVETHAYMNIATQKVYEIKSKLLP